MSRHAPPRTTRLDPFADFTPGGNDHGTILQSLAHERAESAEKKELARNAGSLLRRMKQQDPGEQQHSVGRASEASGGASQHGVSQLQRLREAMSGLHGNNNVSAAAGGGGGGGSSTPASTRASPSRADFSAFLGGGGDNNNNSPGGSSVDRDSSFAATGHVSHHRSPGVSSNAGGGGGGGGGGMTTNTAQHILRDMQGLRDAIGRLEQHLMGDMKRRVESHAALQRTVELRVREIAETAEKRAQDRSVKLHHTLDALTQRVSKLEGALATEREKNARLVQELKYHSVRGLQEIRQQLDTERSARSERIASASGQLQQELFRVEEHIAVAKRAREGLSEEVRDAVVRAQEARADAEDKLLQSLMGDVRAMRARLDAETREREQGEEQLAGAMADLAQHLQSL